MIILYFKFFCLRLMLCLALHHLYCKSLENNNLYVKNNVKEKKKLLANRNANIKITFATIKLYKKIVNVDNCTLSFKQVT